MLADDFVIKSNRESGKGRYDILPLPKRKNQYGILMELKQIAKDATEEQIKNRWRKDFNKLNKMITPRS